MLPVWLELGSLSLKCHLEDCSSGAMPIKKKTEVAIPEYIWDKSAGWVVAPWLEVDSNTEGLRCAKDPSTNTRPTNNETSYKRGVPRSPLLAGVGFVFICLVGLAEPLRSSRPMVRVRYLQVQEDRRHGSQPPQLQKAPRPQM